ncbi:uncharacterized protein LOC126278623 isoform X2 [Schistocerca gregaria]|uniref:uncharacterized protein LOC126278623 isoform X2 n=1 Tax=Schistocerca gregaria TaxID=7010 RepID=UPI00211DA8A1|nr:uncharacterized protein LOC126278623 isoform X2 [Schistocerca gregaria]
MCDLVNQLLAVKAISDKDMAKLKSDKYLFYDPLVLMDLRHKQVRKTSRRAAKCSQPKTADIESSRILREEEQRKRVKMRELSIVNRKLDEFKKEIELSKKRFDKHAKILDTSCKFNKKKPTLKAPLSVNCGKTAETGHQKVLQSFKHSSAQMSDENNDFCERDCATNKEQHGTLRPEKTEMINRLEQMQSNNCQTVYQEKENSSESSDYARILPCLMKCPSVTVEVLNSVDNMPKLGDLMSGSKCVSEAANSTTITDTFSDEIIKYKCDSLMCKVMNVECICKCDIDVVGGMQVTIIQQENESSGGKVSIETEQNFSQQSDVKISKNDTIDFIKDTQEVNAAESQVSELEISSKKDRTLEDEGDEQCTHLESCAETALRNSSKKGFAEVFVSTLVRQNMHTNHKKKFLKGNQKKGTSLSVNGTPDNKRDGSQAEILHKYWLLWKDHTFREKQKAKVDRLMSALEEFQKNDQPEQHVQQRAGCHSAGPVLDSQNVGTSREDLSNMAAYNKKKNIRKSVRCQSMPATSNVTSCQDMIDHIENKVRELSAERQKREAALSQEKEEMHMKPYGKVPFWVLQPTRLIATESIRRAQERKEAIKLRLETKRLQQEQQAAAEQMRLEAERERVRALHELVWTQYKRKVSRRLLLDPLRALVAESRQKQAQASAFASRLLLRKYWKAWRQITFEKMNVLSEVVRRIRMRRAFQAFLEIKADSRRQHQVAEDFYDVWILKRQAFLRWRSFVEEQLAHEAAVMQIALEHYNRTLLCRCFRQWYKLRDEKKRKERLEAWRIRVREILPDFMPPDTD